MLFSYIPIVFRPTKNSAILLVDDEKSTIETNMKWIGCPVAEISPFEILLLRGRSSVINIIYLH